MKTAFRRLVRFKTSDGEIKYGEASEQVKVGDEVKTYKGTEPWNLDPSDDQAVIAEVLTECLYISKGEGQLSIGIDSLSSYEHAYLLRHRVELQRTYRRSQVRSTTVPDCFYKAPRFVLLVCAFQMCSLITRTGALAGPYDDVHVDPACQFLDYEGELAFIIGKDVRNYSANDGFEEFLLGYTIGNDVSSRYWQMPERSGGQHGYAKSFDQFGPIGPVIVSTSEIPQPHLDLKTSVNGEERQKSNTSDLLFTVPQILEHLSRGTTLRKGTVVLTGTPSGVAAFMKPPVWLKTGDVVEIEISQIGKIKNKMVIQ
jgi:hypothetical protein